LTKLLTVPELKQLQIAGYIHLPKRLPDHLVSTALRAIERDLQSNFDAARQAEYDNRSYCPDLCAKPPIMDLLLRSPVIALLDQLLGVKHIVWGDGQIAIRKARNHPIAIPPDPHIDGFSTGLNGVPPDRVYSHTVLAGVFLTPITTEFAGNFTVWPQSHFIYERYFRERGVRAITEPMPRPTLKEPLQLKCEPGDVVLAHYQLGHTAAVNTSGNDRIAVFFRVALKSLASNQWKYLTDLWRGWRLPPFK
jgi:ectoine hydroxylase-related dioxygenase (phytanoyl-CoA dioxygenase family)